MNARSLLLLFVTVAALALAAGCGSSGDGEGKANGSTATAVSSVSKPAFVKRASAICEKARSKMLSATGSAPEAIESTLAPALENMAAELSQLGSPAGEEDEVAALLGAIRADTSTLSRERSSISTLAEVEEQFKSSGALATEYGVPKCAFYARFSGGE